MGYPYEITQKALININSRSNNRSDDSSKGKSTRPEDRQSNRKTDNSSPRNHYQILQVDPQAESEIIAAAYKRLARMYHPDVNDSPEASSKMKEINQANKILSDPVKRQEYDEKQKTVNHSTYSRTTAYSESTSNQSYNSSYNETASSPPASNTYTSTSRPSTSKSPTMGHALAGFCILLILLSIITGVTCFLEAI
jgi:DnaJ-class molecular chaperone